MVQFTSVSMPYWSSRGFLVSLQMGKGIYSRFPFSSWMCSPVSLFGKFAVSSGFWSATLPTAPIVLTSSDLDSWLVCALHSGIAVWVSIYGFRSLLIPEKYIMWGVQSPTDYAMPAAVGLRAYWQNGTALVIAQCGEESLSEALRLVRQFRISCEQGQLAF